MSPEEAAKLRLAAIEALQEHLLTDLSEAQQVLYTGLLERLEDTYKDPEQITAVLAEFTRAIHLPVVVAFGESLLNLVELNVTYVKAVGGVTDAELVSLRAPLTSWLQKVYGISVDAQGKVGVTADGYLGSLLTDNTVTRELKLYAYQAQLRGVGLNEYRAGLKEIVTNTTAQGGSQGVYERLYSGAYDQFNQADRVMQDMTAEKLGWSAFLYQGGLIASSRPFCVVRNGKVFLRSEVEKFGTSKDAFGGYSNKAKGEFNGKPAVYNPFIQLGGYSCRHGLSGLPNSAAMNLRSELKEDDKGKLYIKS